MVFGEGEKSDGGERRGRDQDDRILMDLGDSRYCDYSWRKLASPLEN